jgi:hypothetical protein
MTEGNFEKPISFRELPPLEWWAGGVRTALPDVVFEDHFAKVAEEKKIRFSGYRTSRDEKGVYGYNFSRYVRRNFGPVPSVDEYRSALRALADSVVGEEYEEHRTEQPRFRVLFGLVEGYDPANALTHTPEEVKQILGERFIIEPVEILAIGGGRSSYTEPAVSISGEMQDIKAVYTLADQFHQDRIIIEDLGEAKSYAVETRWCKQPDQTIVE